MTRAAANDLSDILNAYRRAAGLTYADVQRLCHVSRSTVIAWMGGTRVPTPDGIVDLLRVTGKQPAHLVIDMERCGWWLRQSSRFHRPEWVR